MIDLDSVPDHLEEMLKDCEAARNKVNRAMDYAELPEVVRMRKDLALSSVQLSREARAWVKEKRALGKNLSIGEQIGLAAAFVSKLSSADRREFLSAIGAADYLPATTPAPVSFGDLLE